MGVWNDIAQGLGGMRGLVCGLKDQADSVPGEGFIDPGSQPGMTWHMGRGADARYQVERQTPSLLCLQPHPLQPSGPAFPTV